MTGSPFHPSPAGLDLPSLLAQHAGRFSPVVDLDLNAPPVWVPDLTAANPALHQLDLTDTAAFEAYIFGEMARRQTPVAVGGYAEDRFLYQRSPHFQGEEPRSVHLGVDVWALAGTPVYAPLGGHLHSFANNDRFGDYGYTVIVAHHLTGQWFYTLYGHLAARSAQLWQVGRTVAAGELLAWLGPPAENGHWPPHLHFQIIADLQGHQGDYPGVARPSQAPAYLANCPDPNLILGCRWLP
jgi:peptidoglycan LD-endopeptidase LytH